MSEDKLGEDEVVESTVPAVAKPLIQEKPTMSLDIYYSMKKVRPGHRAGMTAYAKTKHGVVRGAMKTIEEWNAVFAAY